VVTLAIFLYVAFVVGAAAFTLANIVPVALACVIGALICAGRFELRYIWDRAHGRKPRTVPRHPAGHH
jgi:hypothetical protein